MARESVEAQLVALARTSPELARHIADAGAAAVRHAREAEEFYRRFHWGRRGGREARRVTAPIVLAGEPLVELGLLGEIGYVARKGRERDASLYVHDFSHPLPVLAYSLASRALVICGGGYRVEERGIVG